MSLRQYGAVCHKSSVVCHGIHRWEMWTAAVSQLIGGEAAWMSQLIGGEATVQEADTCWKV